VACSSHTDESDSKPNHVPQDIFMPDAIAATTIPIFRLGDWLLSSGFSAIFWVYRQSAKVIENAFGD